MKIKNKKNKANCTGVTVVVVNNTGINNKNSPS
jgi:hypothetical protein